MTESAFTWTPTSGLEFYFKKLWWFFLSFRRAAWVSLWLFSPTSNMWCSMKTPSCSWKPEASSLITSCPPLLNTSWRSWRRLTQVRSPLSNHTHPTLSHLCFCLPCSPLKLENQRKVILLSLCVECKLGIEDCLVLELLRWFKCDFFSWVDSLPCSQCGGPTKHGPALGPTAEELRWGAQRVENHYCQSCQLSTRFPRCVCVGVCVWERERQRHF